MKYSLPELLDGVSEVQNVDVGQVAHLAESLGGRRVKALVPTFKGVTVVGRHARLRVPPVAARAPRQL